MARPMLQKSQDKCIAGMLQLDGDLGHGPVPVLPENWGLSSLILKPLQYLCAFPHHHCRAIYEEEASSTLFTEFIL